MSNETTEQGDFNWIIETSSETFERDVFEQSRETPVIVDFWAAWCAPCRALAPILENLTIEHDGAFVLVKANTEELPAEAGRFGVQGIPAVYAVVNGEVVDFFSGALPEQSIRDWLANVLLAGQAMRAGQLCESDPAAAEVLYRELIEAKPNDANFQIGLATALLNQGDQDACREILTQLEKRGFLEPEAERLKASLELDAAAAVDPEEIRNALANDPENRALQLQLAQALAGAKQFKEALETGLKMVQADKTGEGEQARELMVDIFRVLPPDSELTSEFRRKLSMALY